MLGFKEWLMESTTFPYRSVGHGGRGGLGKRGDYLWAYDGNKVIFYRIKSQIEKAAHSHLDIFQDLIAQGRFEKDTKRVSVSLNLLDSLPLKVKQELQNKFGKDIVFVPTGGLHKIKWK